MGKEIYKFDQESFIYVKVEYSVWRKIFRLFRIVGFAVILAMGFYLLFSLFLASPQERKLQYELDYFTQQYELINLEFDQVETALEDMQKRDDNVYRVVFNSEPYSSSVREAGVGGNNWYQEVLDGYDNSDVVIQTAERLDLILKKLLIQASSFDEIINLSTERKEMLAHVPAIQPISSKDLTHIASGWGYRMHPIYHIRKFHYGIDLIAKSGTSIYAAGAGTISNVKTSKTGYGKHVVVNHGYGFKTLYAHLSKFNVKVGDKVNRGDVIGFVGNTGTSTSAHLHYEVHKNNKKVDPKHYFFQDLTPLEYEQMIELCSNNGQNLD